METGTEALYLHTGFSGLESKNDPATVGDEGDKDTAPQSHTQQPKELSWTFRDLISGQTRSRGFNSNQIFQDWSVYEAELEVFLKII